jgi:hypothetical protein
MAEAATDASGDILGGRVGSRGRRNTRRYEGVDDRENLRIRLR